MAKTILLQHFLEGSAFRNPHKIAVNDGISSLCYRDLSTLTNKIARCLKAMGVDRQDRVAICLQRSVNGLASILGVLKADAIYVPLDDKTPVERWISIVEDAAPKVIICDNKTSSIVQEGLTRIGVTIPVLNVSSESKNQAHMRGREFINTFDGRELVCFNIPNDIAYILYTSGSSGRPKGVMISHANVKSYIDWAVSYFNISDEDRILGTAPFHFDMSTFDIYCSLKAGATFCIANDIQTLFPAELVKFIEQQKVTLWKGVASLLMYMSRAGVLTQGAMPSLRQVLFAGETLPTKYLIDWMTIYPEKTFYNAYGPTETTGVSTCYRVSCIPEGPQVRIPIGVPRDGTRVLLLSEEQTEVPMGAVGELCIAGQGLALGYLNDPEKTSRAFIAHPLSRSGDLIYKTGDLARWLPDGNLEYLGRQDRQLKFMGYRIEAGEVEQALLSIPHVKDTAVDLIESKLNAGILELAAFWESDGDIDETTIFAELKKRLPVYMIPKRFIRVEKMPRCDRGKIKLDALSEHLQVI